MKAETVELVRGSGNVFRDLGRENPDVEQLKALLAAEIIQALDRDGLTILAAEARTGFAAADFHRIRKALGGVDPEDLVRQALVALEQGYTGIALQQLAGLMRPTLSDLGTLPDRAFAEMGLKAINREQAVDLLLPAEL